MNGTTKRTFKRETFSFLQVMLYMNFLCKIFSTNGTFVALSANFGMFQILSLFKVQSWKIKLSKIITLDNTLFIN